MVVRNESLRLPFLLKYYLSLGVHRIFVIDNDSTDDTPSIVLSEKKAHFFSIRDKFKRKAHWIDALLHHHGVGHWCLVVDADEFLKYPHQETIALQDLCAFLDRDSKTALPAFLLDMYPDKALNQTVYEKNTDPLSVASWFDGPQSGSYANKKTEGPVSRRGGVRRRIFGLSASLTKYPLVKFHPRMFLSQGTHWIEGAYIANMQAVLLHFKYLHDFSDKVHQEARREAYWRDALEYKQYSKVIDGSPELNLHSPSASVRFIDGDQLIKLGFMKSDARWDALED